MSKVFTAKQVCERALRAIGEFPVTESAPDGEKLREAMEWLDLIMSEKAGTTTLFFFHTEALPIALTNGTTEYDLNDTLGSNLPVDEVQWPVEAWLQDSAGNRTKIEIATRGKFENVPNAADTGPPCMIHIDRLTPDPTLRIYPTPATTDTTTYTLELIVQTYAPNVAPRGVTGTTPQGSAAHGFRQAWQRWLILRLSIDLGGGPLIKLPQATLNNWRVDERDARLALEAFENREHDTEDPVTEAWGM